MCRTAFSLSIMLFLAHNSVNAQTIYKCTEDGKVSYGQTPCAGAPGVALPPPPAAVDSGADTARLNKTADRMMAARHKREARFEREQLAQARVAEARNRRCGLLRLKKSWADKDARGAPGAKFEAAKENARRAGQLLKLECPD